jgi:hypothetical protein
MRYINGSMTPQEAKEKASNVMMVKKIRDYSEESVFKKKAEKAMAFIKKHGIPKSFKKKAIK